MSLRTVVVFLSIGLLLSSCTGNNNSNLTDGLDKKMDSISEAYVKMILKIGLLDSDYVDAYYGPVEWKPVHSDSSMESTLLNKQLSLEADSLLTKLEALKDYKADQLRILRYRFLYKQILAAKAKLFMLSGGSFSFDDESKALYDATASVHSDKYFQSVIDQLNKLLPGKGNILLRLDEFKKSFIIPKEKLDTVFSAAIKECRKRTLQHIQLPANESFKVEFVTNKPWGGYNWYKGNSFSLIQVNTDLPIYIERAIDLAAHEGYPGHHVYNTLLEADLVRKRGWMEFTVYPLFSPQSLIAEGSANFGIYVAFPGEERIKFEKEVLFPLAGLDSSKADRYYAVLNVLEKLSYAGNEAARNYLNGIWTEKETIAWLGKFALMTPERAKQRIKFIDKYRSYVINYNLGEDIVKDYIIRNGGTDSHPEKRWQLMKMLLSTPQTPSGLINANQ